MSNLATIKLIIVLLLALTVHNATIYEVSNSESSIATYRLMIKQSNEKTIRKINSQSRGYTLYPYPEFIIYTLQELKYIGKNQQMYKHPLQGIQINVQQRDRDDFQDPRYVLSNRPSKIVNNTGPTGVVKQQGFCGSCYSFAGNSVVNYAVNKFFNASQDKKNYKQASEQQIIQCSFQQRNKGCDGGWPHYVFSYVRRYGVLTDKRYQYRHETLRNSIIRSCSVTRQTPREMYIGNSPIKISQNNNIRALVNLVDKHKVLAIGVSSDYFHFKYYKSGILTACGNSSRIDHAVTLVGYVIDHQEQQYAWIVKNSWGTKWGQNGHISISMEDNMCNLLNYASYFEY